MGSYSVTVTVSDGNGGTDSETFTWTVTEANVAPVLASIGNKTNVTGDTVNVAVSATDGNTSPTLTYSATGLPPGLSINASTGAITGSPTTAGSYSVTVTVPPLPSLTVTVTE